jgi:hypothetical protein
MEGYERSIQPLLTSSITGEIIVKFIVTPLLKMLDYITRTRFKVTLL